MRASCVPLLMLAACAAPRAALPGFVPAGWELALDADFGSAEPGPELVFSDPAAWRRSELGLELLGPSDYAPPHRSPLSIALIADLAPGDFVLEAEVLQTGREYGHRDLVFFLGFDAPDRFYYVHLASAPDAHAHNVFVVDGAPRVALAPVAERGIDWGQGQWHRVRIERRAAAGTIEVWFDGRPVLSASDGRFARGRVGFGSFDDSGALRRLRLWAPPGSSAAPGRVRF